MLQQIKIFSALSLLFSQGRGRKAGEAAINRVSCMAPVLKSGSIL